MDVSAASEVSRERGAGDAAAGDGPGLSHNHQERKELLWKAFLVSDIFTSVLTAAVTDWGQKRGRFEGKSNILH